MEILMLLVDVVMWVIVIVFGIMILSLLIARFEMVEKDDFWGSLVAGLSMLGIYTWFAILLSK